MTNDEEYLAEIKYKLDKLVRSAEVIEVEGHLPMDQYHRFTEDMVYYPNEIWIEWQHWTNKTLRIEGYCVKYEPIIESNAITPPVHYRLRIQSKQFNMWNE